MLYLPNVRQALAAEALALRFAAGHEARGGRDDGDAEPAEHAWHLGLPRVDAKAGLGDAAQAGDRRELADVLHPEDELARIRRRLVTGDEALVAQNARDFGLHAARPHGPGLVAPDRRVSAA